MKPTEPKVKTHLKAKKGRPCKLTPETHALIIQGMLAGNYVETASALASVGKQTLYKWLRVGASKPPGNKFRDFRDAVIKAQAQSEAADVAAIGMDRHWQARAWRLERKFPERWGIRVRLQVETELNGFLDRLEAILPPDIFDVVLDAAAVTTGRATPRTTTAQAGADASLPPEPGDSPEG